MYGLGMKYSIAASDTCKSPFLLIANKAPDDLIRMQFDQDGRSTIDTTPQGTRLLVSTFSTGGWESQQHILASRATSI